MVEGDKLKAWKKANKANIFRLQIDLNHNNPKDVPIIEKLQEQRNKAEYVRTLIRRDLDGE